VRNRRVVGTAREGKMEPLERRGSRCCKGKLLSRGARLVLIKACLASIHMYLLSFIKFPKWAIKALNTHLANCFWNDSDGNHKYHLANWESISMPKEFGGLGIPNLRELNICLLGSWLKRYSCTDSKL